MVNVNVRTVNVKLRKNVNKWKKLNNNVHKNVVNVVVKIVAVMTKNNMGKNNVKNKRIAVIQKNAV
jgi:hypothetical protein